MQNSGQMPGSVFVTGGTGYIGSRLLPMLAASDDCRIVCLSRASQREDWPTSSLSNPISRTVPDTEMRWEDAIRCCTWQP